MIRIPVRPKASGFNLTPMIDMVFLLLVYFLLTTNFIEEEGIGVRLPSAASRAAHDPHEIAVVLTRDGDAFLAGERVPLEALAGRFRQLISGDDTTVVVRGDREAALQSCVTVMEAAKTAGAARIVVATVNDGGEP